MDGRADSYYIRVFFLLCLRVYQKNVSLPLGTVVIFSLIESSCVSVPLYWMEVNLIRGFIPDMVRVISCGFPAAAAEQEADASACVRLELLIVSVIS